VVLYCSRKRIVKSLVFEFFSFWAKWRPAIPVPTIIIDGIYYYGRNLIWGCGFVFLKHIMSEFFVIKGTSASGYLLQFDGGAVPNPGSCGSGAVLFDSDGTCLWELGEYSAYGTNNTAEYRGLELGLEKALAIGVRHINIEGDSMLVIKQICRLWAVKAPGLKDVYKRVSSLLQKFDSVSCRHIYREHNIRADAITNELQLTKTSFERKI